jgi:hypothetical protein
MSTEKMWEEFEAWYLGKFCGGQARLFRCVNADQVYYFTEVQSKWDAWQASRAAIEVELPEPYAVVGDYAACGGGRSVWDVEYAEKIDDHMCQKTNLYTREQLESAGLKVKP